jgi:GNAT superfamily N-acetyltransferase
VTIRSDAIVRLLLTAPVSLCGADQGRAITRTPNAASRAVNWSAERTARTCVTASPQLVRLTTTYDQHVGEIRVREASRDDAAFLALAMLEADRGHTGIGSWDVMFPGADDERLAILAALACASQPSYVHWSTFLVAEIGDRPIGTVAGYVPDLMPSELFAAACREVLDSRGEAALSRDGAWSPEYFTVEMPGDTLRVEWVYTDPAFRAQGVSAQLITRLVDDARTRGVATAHVGTYIGNDPAITTYRRVGFEEFAECRHRDYERRFKAPGLVFLRRVL